MRKYKLIRIDVPFKDREGTFPTFKTIVKDENGQELWINVFFDKTKVNVNQFVEKCYLVASNDEDVHDPTSLTPYVNKKGEEVYPYFYIEGVEKFVVLKKHDAPKFSFAVDDDELPF